MSEIGEQARGPESGMKEQMGVFAGLLGAWYPKDYVVGVIDDIEEAKRAAEDLRRAGFPEPDVRLFPSQEIVEALRMIEAHRNAFQRVGAAIESNLTEEGLANEDYNEDAREGRQILTALAVEPEEIERARKVFVAHGARRIMHYMKWTITDLR